MRVQGKISKEEPLDYYYHICPNHLKLVGLGMQNFHLYRPMCKISIQLLRLQKPLVMEDQPIATKIPHNAQ